MTTVSNVLSFRRLDQAKSSVCLVATHALMVAALVASSFALAAPPAGAATTPVAWATKVCKGLDQWVTALQDRATATTSKPPTGTKATQKALVGFLKQAEGDSKRLTTTLRKAGLLSGSDGKQIAETFRDLAAQATKTITTARKAVQEAKTTDPTTFVGQAHSAEDALENTFERSENVLGSFRTLDQPPFIHAFPPTTASCTALNDKLTAAMTDNAPGSKLDIGSLSPGTGPVGTVVKIGFVGTDPAGIKACQESSAYRSEFLGAEGAKLSLGAADVRVPDGAPQGTATIRVVCYFPGQHGRPLMRSLCGVFLVTSSAFSAGELVRNVGRACPQTGRVLGGDAMISAQRALGGTFDALLRPLG